MAVQTYTSVKVPGVHEEAHVVTWADLLTANTGTPIEMPSFGKKCVQVNGTFGGATIVIQGSNDGTNWVTLNDTAATPGALSFTAAGFKQILETPRYLRPSVSGGAAAAIDVTLVVAK